MKRLVCLVFALALYLRVLIQLIFTIFKINCALQMLKHTDPEREYHLLRTVYVNLLHIEAVCLFLIKTGLEVSCYELLISNQPRKLPMHHYTVITSAPRFPYINKHSDFCAEK